MKPEKPEDMLDWLIENRERFPARLSVLTNAELEAVFDYLKTVLLTLREKKRH